MKPPYRVPSMDEIRAVPSNGLTMVSTFSGCGGSCLGFRMVGFRVLWANEFITEARDSYRANADPRTVLDERDIRLVTADEIRAAVGGVDVDVLEGSPPCSSFSTAGKRERSWGKVNAYSETAQRTDDLFFEFARILEGLQPRAFVAENVSGLVKGTSKGYFKEILRRLSTAGYRVRAQLLDASWLGVPQARQRVFFVGVRDGVAAEPVFPKPLPYRYSVRDALGVGTKKGIRSLDEPLLTVMTTNAAYTQSEMTLLVRPKLVDPETREEIGLDRYAIGREYDKLDAGGQSEKYFQLVRTDAAKPTGTITATGGSVGAAGVTHPFERRKFSIPELRRLCSFPDDFVLTGSYAQRWERLGRSVPPVMMAAVARELADVLKKETP